MQTPSLDSQNLCPIWNTPAIIAPYLGDYKDVFSSRAGGAYRIHGTVIAILENADDITKSKLTTWLIEQRESGTRIPFITNEILSSVKLRPVLKYSKRIENFFKCLAVADPSIGSFIYIDSEITELLVPSNFEKDEDGNQHINFLFLMAYIEAQSKYDLTELENFLFHLNDSGFFQAD